MTERIHKSNFTWIGLKFGGFKFDWFIKHLFEFQFVYNKQKNKQNEIVSKINLTSYKI